jgi:flagellar motor switch protein FliG
MLSKILEQFDEKFVASNIGKIYNWKATSMMNCTEVRNFLSQSIEQALNGGFRQGRKAEREEIIKGLQFNKLCTYCLKPLGKGSTSDWCSECLNDN